MTEAADEFSVIRDYFSFSEATASVPVGIGDDAAVVRPAAGTELLIAVDTLVESVHFPQATPAAAVGHRALAVNLSDIAAMGGEPRWVTLALTMPGFDAHWLQDFSEGLHRAAAHAELQLIGGDTTRGPLTITVSVIGEVPTGTRLLRSGASAGDDIWVSGSLGDAAAGLALLQAAGGAGSRDEQYLVDRFLWPAPRSVLGAQLRGIASAAIDVSDGLLADMGHLLTASECGAMIDADAVPMSSALKNNRGEDALSLALTGGDDYELLFTAPRERRLEMPRETGWRIGEITSAQGIKLMQNGAPIPLPEVTGYNHFGAPG